MTNPDCDKPHLATGVEGEALAQGANNVAGSPLLLRHDFTDSELVIGLVGAVGTDLDAVIEILQQRLVVAHYEVQLVRIAEDIIPQIAPIGEVEGEDAFARLTAKMDAGNTARQSSGDNSVLALGTAMWVAQKRDKDENGTKHAPRRAYIIKSLKHPDEVHRMREIYSEGFYLIGVHAELSRRRHHLIEKRRIDAANADRLIKRDEDEHKAYGQRVTDTFHLSDFFIRLSSNNDRLQTASGGFLTLFLAILIGHRHLTSMRCSWHSSRRFGLPISRDRLEQ